MCADRKPRPADLTCSETDRDLMSRGGWIKSAPAESGRTPGAQILGLV
jgi:hypothetical protein